MVGRDILKTVIFTRSQNKAGLGLYARVNQYFILKGGHVTVPHARKRFFQIDLTLFLPNASKQRIPTYIYIYMYII